MTSDATLITVRLDLLLVHAVACFGLVLAVSLHTLCTLPSCPCAAIFLQALAAATGKTDGAIKKAYEESGDLGLVACSSRGSQKTLFPLPPLTLRSVREGWQGQCLDTITCSDCVHAMLWCAQLVRHDMPVLMQDREAHIACQLSTHPPGFAGVCGLQADCRGVG